MKGNIWNDILQDYINYIMDTMNLINIYLQSLQISQSFKCTIFKLLYLIRMYRSINTIIKIYTLSIQFTLANIIARPLMLNIPCHNIHIIIANNKRGNDILPPAIRIPFIMNLTIIFYSINIDHLWQTDTAFYPMPVPFLR